VDSSRNILGEICITPKQIKRCKYRGKNMVIDI
jgi:hypothetical protein